MPRGFGLIGLRRPPTLIGKEPRVSQNERTIERSPAGRERGSRWCTAGATRSAYALVARRYHRELEVVAQGRGERLGRRRRRAQLSAGQGGGGAACQAVRLERAAAPVV